MYSGSCNWQFPYFRWLLEITEPNLCLTFWKYIRLHGLNFVYQLHVGLCSHEKHFPPFQSKVKKYRNISNLPLKIFLKKIFKSVFKQDKYNFTKKIEFEYFHYEKLYMSQKIANPLCPFLKRINLFEHSPAIPTHTSTPPQIIFK